MEAAPPKVSQTLGGFGLRAHGIQVDIVRDLGERVPGLHVQGLIAPLKRPPRLALIPVESRGPRPLQPFHAPLKFGSEVSRARWK
jgi:hypothetical protein